MSLPSSMEEVVRPFEAAFTRPSFERFVHLLLAAILTTGSRTVSNLLRTLDALAEGHASSFHRLFSVRRWLSWRLSHTLCRLILNSFYQGGDPVRLAGDDTVDGHKGKKVYGKSCHRDAVRSTHSHMAYRWGHKWVVLSILVRLPLCKRPWALPCLVALYRTPEVNKKLGIPHKTPPEIMRGLLAQLLRWFPEKKFVFSGDQSFGTHDLASFAHRYQDQLSLISKFRPDANLYEMPSPRRPGKRGRGRVKGVRLPSPEKVVKKAKKRTRLTVQWYGGQDRKVEVVSGAAYWYRAGHGLVFVHWVFVHDLTGTHRDEYFFTTDSAMAPKTIIGHYTGRWSLETTFQEMRSYIGLESTRGWSKNTVLRMAPSLFGLYSVVALLYQKLPARSRWKGKIAIQWRGKVDLTFSDVLTAVRRWLWLDVVFTTLQKTAPFPKLPRRLEATLLYALAPAA